jgi:hypothetical protein
MCPRGSNLMVWHGCNETKFGLRPAAPNRGRGSEKRIGENLTKEAICAHPHATIQGSRAAVPHPRAKFQYGRPCAWGRRVGRNEENAGLTGS